MNPIKLARPLKKQVRVLSRSMFIDRPVDKPTILLSSSGRSGSTWVQSILAATAPTRVMFEPFHPEHVKLVRGWPRCRYIAPESAEPEVDRIVGAILDGRVRGRWIDFNNRRLTSQLRLVKGIRTNLMLGYVRRRFPRVSNVLLLLRNPFSVALSKMKLNWKNGLESLLSQEVMVERHFGDKVELLHDASGDV